MFLSYRIFTSSIAMLGLAVTSAFVLPVEAQVSRWASADDSTARTLIESERKWAESGCDHNNIEQTILAEDFYGTAPDGTHYSRKEAIEETQNAKTFERGCRMFEVKVHYFGDNMAILYGSEVAVRPPKDGHEHTVKLTWTDTWLRRNGKWQIVAAQDMPSEEK
jgi:Domain of unknown function (DUF4440)